CSVHRRAFIAFESSTVQTDRHQVRGNAQRVLALITDSVAMTYSIERRPAPERPANPTPSAVSAAAMKSRPSRGHLVYASRGNLGYASRGNLVYGGSCEPKSGAFLC